MGSIDMSQTPRSCQKLVPGSVSRRTHSPSRRSRNPCFAIPQKANDLFFRIALLHASDPFPVKSDSRSQRY